MAQLIPINVPITTLPTSTQAFVIDKHLPSCVLPQWGICYLKSAGVGEFLSVEFYIFLLIKQEVKVAKC